MVSAASLILELAGSVKKGANPSEMGGQTDPLALLSSAIEASDIQGSNSDFLNILLQKAQQGTDEFLEALSSLGIVLPKGDIQVQDGHLHFEPSVLNQGLPESLEDVPPSEQIKMLMVSGASAEDIVNLIASLTEAKMKDFSHQDISHDTLELPETTEGLPSVKEQKPETEKNTVDETQTVDLSSIIAVPALPVVSHTAQKIISDIQSEKGVVIDGQPEQKQKNPTDGFSFPVNRAFLGKLGHAEEFKSVTNIQEKTTTAIPFVLEASQDISSPNGGVDNRIDRISPAFLAQSSLEGLAETLAQTPSAPPVQDETSTTLNAKDIQVIRGYSQVGTLFPAQETDQLPVVETSSKLHQPVGQPSGLVQTTLEKASVFHEKVLSPSEQQMLYQSVQNDKQQFKHALRSNLPVLDVQEQPQKNEAVQGVNPQKVTTVQEAVSVINQSSPSALPLVQEAQNQTTQVFTHQKTVSEPVQLVSPQQATPQVQTATPVAPSAQSALTQPVSPDHSASSVYKQVENLVNNGKKAFHIQHNSAVNSFEKQTFTPVESVKDNAFASSGDTITTDTSSSGMQGSDFLSALTKQDASSVKMAQAQAMPSVPIPLKQVILQDGVQLTLYKTDESTLEIALDPNDFGKVDLILHKKEGQTHVVVKAETQEALDLIRKDIAILQKTLREVGINPTQTHFQLDSGTNGQGAFSQNNGSSSQHQSSNGQQQQFSAGGQEMSNSSHGSSSGSTGSGGQNGQGSASGLSGVKGGGDNGQDTPHAKTPQQTQPIKPSSSTERLDLRL